MKEIFAGMIVFLFGAFAGGKIHAVWIAPPPPMVVSVNIPSPSLDCIAMDRPLTSKPHWRTELKRIAEDMPK